MFEQPVPPAVKEKLSRPRWSYPIPFFTLSKIGRRIVSPYWWPRLFLDTGVKPSPFFGFCWDLLEPLSSPFLPGFFQTYCGRSPPRTFHAGVEVSMDAALVGDARLSPPFASYSPFRAASRFSHFPFSWLLFLEAVPLPLVLFFLGKCSSFPLCALVDLSPPIAVRMPRLLLG